MVNAGRAAAEVAQLLSSRVARAVDDLAQKLGQSPTEAGAEVKRLQQVLVSSRRAIPPEPKLPESTLWQRIEELRLRTMDWTFAMTLSWQVLATLRNAIFGPRFNVPIGLIGLVVTLSALSTRLLRPQWRRRTNVVMLILLIGNSVPTLWGWFARAPISPPFLAPLIVLSLLAALTVGPLFAFVALALWALTSVVALHFYPGIAWTAPINLFATSAVLAWFLRQWPLDLWQAIRAREEAAALKIRERRRLVATLFHDLANPLTVITFGVDRLALGAKGSSAVDDMRSMVRRMQATLEAVLGGRMVMESLPVGKLCDDLETLFRDRLARKGLALRVTGPRSTTLRCDVALLRDSVLANLFANALKFSPRGGTIELSITEEAEFVVLTLADRGPGLPDDVRKAFERGVRAPSHPGTAGEAGSGYGLMLAREYLQEMGGSLDLQPREGCGLLARIALRRANAGAP
jgi:signal transduction histidine kinase